MNCPVCNGDSKVLETRSDSSNNIIKRRRECMTCAKRFVTFEKIADRPLFVLKKKGHKELFDQAKLLKGLIKACEKRPVTIEQLECLVESVEKTLKKEYSEVDSAIIGETIMKKLVDIDEVSYVRFASVYKEFDNIDTFIKEIENLRAF